MLGGLSITFVDCSILVRRSARKEVNDLISDGCFRSDVRNEEVSIVKDGLLIAVELGVKKGMIKEM